MIALKVALIYMVCAVVLLAAAGLYVSLLLWAARVSPRFLRWPVAFLAYVVFAIMIVSPLFIVLSLEPARQAMASNWLAHAFGLLGYVASVIPAVWYIFRRRLSELREAGFYR